MHLLEQNVSYPANKSDNYRQKHYTVCREEELSSFKVKEDTQGWLHEIKTDAYYKVLKPLI